MRFRFRSASRTPRELGTCGLVGYRLRNIRKVRRIVLLRLSFLASPMGKSQARSRGGRRATLRLMSLFCAEKSSGTFADAKGSAPIPCGGGAFDGAENAPGALRHPSATIMLDAAARRMVCASTNLATGVQT